MWYHAWPISLNILLSRYRNVHTYLRKRRQIESQIPWLLHLIYIIISIETLPIHPCSLFLSSSVSSQVVTGYRWRPIHSHDCLLIDLFGRQAPNSQFPDSQIFALFELDRMGPLVIFNWFLVSRVSTYSMPGPIGFSTRWDR